MELKNKTALFLGDSITFGVYVNDHENNRFDNILKKLAKLGKTYNYGLSGSRIAPQVLTNEPITYDSESFCERSKSMEKEADLIVVFGGTNDYGHGNAPFGDKSDRTDKTFCGAVHSLMKYLREEYPASTIVFMTPMHRVNDSIPAKHPLKGATLGKPLEDYVNAIYDAAPLYNINVLDLFHTLPIDPNDEEIKEIYVPDGLHPNDLGHHIIADFLFNYLKAL